MKKVEVKSLLILLLFTSLAIAFNSCNKKDDDPVEKNGLTKDINSFMPKKILDVLDTLGMKINTGGNPPEISGSFIISPDVLYSSNIDDDHIGDKYLDVTVTFSKQDHKKLAINLERIQGSEKGAAHSSFIVGKKDNFSVFTQIKMHDEANNDSCLVAQVLSGTITAEGIKDCYSSLVMLNDFGDPHERYIEIGEARVLYDEDGMSEHTVLNKSGAIKNYIKSGSSLKCAIEK